MPKKKTCSSGCDSPLTRMCFSHETPLYAFPEGAQRGQRRAPGTAPALTSRAWNATRLYNHYLLSRTNGTSVWAAPQSSASPQEEKQGLQKKAPSNRSRSKSTLSQDEWETIKISTFWIKWKKATKQKITETAEMIFQMPLTAAGTEFGVRTLRS